MASAYLPFLAIRRAKSTRVHINKTDPHTKSEPFIGNGVRFCCILVELDDAILILDQSSADLRGRLHEHDTARIGGLRRS